MEEQIKNCIAYLRKLDNINACITGSVLLEYFPDAQQDIDIFAYDEKAFVKLLYTLRFNPMFTILDKKELWKFDDITTSPYNGSLKKLGLCSLKFTYNLCIPVNVIYKEKANSAFDVLQSFDMDIICKAYCLSSKQILDLTNGSTETKIASFNKWNKTFYQPNLWAVSRVLRQFGRCVKYYKRNYNTDPMVHKYIEILQQMMEYENVFDSAKVEEKIDNVKHNGKILITILEKWLKNHLITDDELLLIENTIKNL